MWWCVNMTKIIWYLDIDLRLHSFFNPSNSSIFSVESCWCPCLCLCYWNSFLKRKMNTFMCEHSPSDINSLDSMIVLFLFFCSVFVCVYQHPFSRDFSHLFFGKQVLCMRVNVQAKRQSVKCKKKFNSMKIRIQIGFLLEMENQKAELNWIEFEFWILYERVRLRYMLISFCI